MDSNQILESFKGKVLSGFDASNKLLNFINAAIESVKIEIKTTINKILESIHLTSSMK
ncbi:hypothetical protein CAXC1_220064 [Candidatus Xenohaliotis californiensis]|uniref:Transposase n=1 Tax=Candidatus Xenohaliotis californiensis TaxID=84677 RepID=A0ABP0EVB0_9RICK|nr:hypothetical protein CAXC1_220064 [Candidatus Xenohaliotis californiensis]